MTELFMSLIYTFVMVRNGIYILMCVCTLTYIRKVLNLICKELNFKMFLIILIHILLYFTIDMGKVNENKLGFISLMILLYSVVTYVRLLIESSSKYLLENYNKQQNHNDTE